MEYVCLTTVFRGKFEGRKGWNYFNQMKKNLTLIISIKQSIGRRKRYNAYAVVLVPRFYLGTSFWPRYLHRTRGHILAQYERTRTAVPTWAQFRLRTSHTSINFFASICRFPHDCSFHRKARDKFRMQLRIPKLEPTTLCLSGNRSNLYYNTIIYIDW